jgi:hypothetical protein
LFAALIVRENPKADRYTIHAPATHIVVIHFHHDISQNEDHHNRNAAAGSRVLLQLEATNTPWIPYGTSKQPTRIRF